MVKKSKYNSVEEVPVWQESHKLALKIYKITKSYPKSELYGLTSQIRRCSVSVPANITEGFYRRSLKELLQFLFIARGSLGECRYYLILSRDLGYIAKNDYNDLLRMTNNVGKQLNGWINSINKINNK